MSETYSEAKARRILRDAASAQMLMGAASYVSPLGLGHRARNWSGFFEARVYCRKTYGSCHVGSCWLVSGAY